MFLSLILALFLVQPLAAAEVVPSVTPAENKVSVEKKESIGIIKIYGEISSNIEDTLKKIIVFSEDNMIKGVLLVVDSVGGRCGSSELLFQEIKALSQQKPVVVLIVNDCLSCAYWISTAADWIIAQAASEVGSIGIKIVIEKHKNCQITTQGGYKADFDVTVFHAGKYKVFADANTPATMSTDEIDLVQAHVNKLYDIFISYIARARNLSLEKASQWAEAKVFTGAQALQFGLVDQIGGFSDAVKKLTELITERGVVITQKLAFVE